MGSKKYNGNQDITDLWIDRETYQKTFQVLSKKAVIKRALSISLNKTKENDMFKRVHFYVFFPLVALKEDLQLPASLFILIRI